MNGDFIKKFAEIRAEQIFTPDYFTKVTDSWYFDEKFRFENLKVGKEQRYPNKKESDIYMGYLSDLFDKYRDKYYGEALAQDCYSKCIDCFDRLLQYISNVLYFLYCFIINIKTSTFFTILNILQ